MNARELTCGTPAATSPAMTGREETNLLRERRSLGMRALPARKDRVWMMTASAALGMLGGCVNVSAPDKPIVIELNINIRQEVVYRLDAQAAKTIEENRDIF